MNGFDMSVVGMFNMLYQTGWILLVLFIDAMLFEWFEIKSGVALGGFLFLMIGYFKFEPSILTISVTAVMYTIIGLVYSFWRYRTYVSVKLAEFKDKYLAIDINTDNVLKWSESLTFVSSFKYKAICILGLENES